MITVPEEIKDLLHLDHCQKNIRIHFPNGERSDICNDLIVKDSVSFTESLCSQNELKFGLCESPIFECEVVGVGNIKGASIEVTCEIYCPSTVSGAVYRPDLQDYVYPIYYGAFTVNEAKRQADMVHRKIQALGGLSVNIDYENEIIKIKNNAPFIQTSTPDTRDYNPNIFNTCLMMSGSKGRLPYATYTELTPQYVNFGISGFISFSSIGLVLRCLAYPLSDLDEDKVFFADYGKATKTKDEIINEVLGDDPSEWDYGDRLIISNLFKEFIYSKNIFGCGVITTGLRNPQPVPGNVSSFFEGHSVGFQNGRYVYPYQVVQYYGEYLPGTEWGNYIVIPVAASLVVNGSTVRTSTFNTGKIYEVDMSNYPQERNAYPRDIQGTVSDSFYTYPILSFDVEKVNYLEIINSIMELNGEFGYMNRDGIFDSINIKRKFGMTPGVALYPDPSLYPKTVTGGKLLPKDYQTCWYDDEYTMQYGAVKCKYKNASNEDIEYVYYLTGFDDFTDKNSYKVYSLEQNAYIQGNIWTDVEIQAICANVAANIEGVSYMPVDFVGRGLPYVEAGDTFEILTKSNDSITTIVLHRTITGEQTLTDSYKSV